MVKCELFLSSFFVLQDHSLVENMRCKIPNLQMKCKSTKGGINHEMYCRYGYRYIQNCMKLDAYQLKEASQYPYLPVYNLIQCISPPPILEPKNEFVLLLGKNILENLIFCLSGLLICPELLFYDDNLLITTL